MTKNSEAPRRVSLTRRHLLQAGIASAGLVAGTGSEIFRPAAAWAASHELKNPGHPYVPTPGHP